LYQPETWAPKRPFSVWRNITVIGGSRVQQERGTQFNESKLESGLDTIRIGNYRRRTCNSALINVNSKEGFTMTLRLSKGSAFALLLMSAAGALCACNMGNQQATRPAAIPDTRAADEALIRNVDTEWVKTVAGKDAQQSSSYYAEDGLLMAPGAPIASGKEEIQKTWAGMLATPGFALTFAPAKVTVSRSGDLAYEVGDYEMTINDKKGKPQTVKAKYVVVWGKQADGKWKALVDAPTTTH
jgi:uncharacterized protein (TIGR02246 family)